MEYTFSSNGINNYIEDLKLYIAKKEDYSKAERMIVPIVYYINTGRACSDFIKRMLGTKFYSIYVVLKREKSIDETINMLKTKLR